MPRLTWILATLIATSWLALSAGADTLKEQAKKDVIAGLEAQNAGRYDEAIALYKKAYDAVPHPEILFNLAQAYRLKGDADNALDHYQRYLRVEPDGRVAADATRWVAVLEKRVAQRKTGAAKTSTAKADTKTDTSKANTAKTDVAKTNTAKTDTSKTDAAKTGSVKSDGGRTDIAKTDPAGDGARKPELANGGAAAGDGARLGATMRTSDGVSTVALGEPRDDGGVMSRHRYAVIAAGAGGALAIGGTIFGVLARSKRDEALAICGDDRRCDTADDTSRGNALMAASRTRGTAATVLFVLGGAGVATGAVLWFTGRESTGSSALAPVIAPSTVGVTWGGRF